MYSATYKTRCKSTGVFAASLSLLSLAGRAPLQGFAELPQELEIELALSALPESLQPEATIY